MDVLDVLTKIGYVELQDFGKEYRTRPLYRPSDNRTSLCIKKTTGEWYDFGGREGGGLAQLVQKTMQLPTLENVKEFLGDLPVTSQSQPDVELSHIKKFDKGLLLKLKKDHSYWQGRGITEDTVSTFMGGVTYNGRMSHRYVFPIFDDREDLIGFSGRALKDDPNYPKWKHIGAKSNWLYPLKWNAHYIMQKREAILIESIGDMLSLWQNDVRNTIVTFGLDISPKVIQFLLRIDAQRVLLAFNNDEGNNLVGNEAANEGKEELSKYFDPQQIVVALPTQKDFGVMSPTLIDEWRTQFNV